MHELSVVQGIVATTTGILAERGIEKASFLTLVIGDHTGVLPQYVEMYYHEVCEGTALAGSELRIETVETEYFCRDCGHVFRPVSFGREDSKEDRCPECGSKDLEVIAGNELMIREVGYEDR